MRGCPLPLGKRSREKLSTCDPELIRFVETLSSEIDAGLCPMVKDITVLCGHRGEREQNQAFIDGTSKLPWPKSKHNSLPSRAVDVVPYPIDWDNMAPFEALRKYGLALAARLGIKVRIISWDWPHWELA